MDHQISVLKSVMNMRKNDKRVRVIHKENAGLLRKKYRYKRSKG